jgi:hypothetical protein
MKTQQDERLRKMGEIRDRLNVTVLARFGDEDRAHAYAELWHVGKTTVMVHFQKCIGSSMYSISIYVQEPNPSATFEETEAMLAKLAEGKAL